MPGFAALAVLKRVPWPVWAALALVAVFLVGRCTRDDRSDVKAQVEQTNRSGDAAAASAADAIGTLEHRVASEDAIDEAVAETMKNIDGAATPADIRSHIVNAVCGAPQHRNDPACRKASQ